MDSKSSFERSVVNIFLQLYNEVNDSSITFLKAGDPSKKEPDILCDDNFSIEITTSYDNQSQPKRFWEEIKGIQQNSPNRELALHTQAELQNAINKKLEKLKKGLYSGVDFSKIILLCYCGSPLFDHRTAERIQAEYQPFKDDHPFELCFYEIWILWWEGGNDYRILKLE